MELVFATNNKHKLEELQAILGNQIKLLSLKEIGCEGAILGKAIYEGKITLKELRDLC